MSKYLIAEVTVNKLDGAKVAYRSKRNDVRTTSNLTSEFLLKFDTAEEAAENLESVHQCVVKADWL